jgi:hypothetical protein
MGSRGGVVRALGAGAIQLGRGLIVLVVAGLVVGMLLISRSTQPGPQPSAIAAAEVVDSAAPSDTPELEAPTEDPTDSPTEDPTDSPTPDPTDTPSAPVVKVTPVPTERPTPKPKCSMSGHFGQTLSACGVSVKVSLTSDTKSVGAPDDKYSEPVAFLITAVFTDPKFGERTPVTDVNSGDNQGFAWWPDVDHPLVSGTTYTLVVYVRPGVSTKLVIGFGPTTLPEFTFKK